MLVFLLLFLAVVLGYGRIDLPIARLPATFSMVSWSVRSGDGRGQTALLLRLLGRAYSSFTTKRSRTFGWVPS